MICRDCTTTPEHVGCAGRCFPCHQAAARDWARRILAAGRIGPGACTAVYLESVADMGGDLTRARAEVVACDLEVNR